MRVKSSVVSEVSACAITMRVQSETFLKFRMRMHRRFCCMGTWEVLERHEFTAAHAQLAGEHIALKMHRVEIN